ncbi:MAG: methyltransferase family protein [Anaerolineae bacterium]
MNQPTIGSSSVYASVFGLSFLCWLLFEMWVFSRDRGKQRRGSLGSGLLVITVFVAGIIIGMNMPNIAPSFNIQDHAGIHFVAGIVLVWAGLVLRYWSIRTLGRFFSTRLVIQDRHELITSGPYSILRHPSYTGAVLTFIGFGLGAGNWLSLLVLLATALISYAWRIRSEEKLLLAEFGDAFLQHKKHTWAIIPFVW